jgi:pyrroloquinoline quinone (PQQ) biosynthesis protein C
MIAQQREISSLDRHPFIQRWFAGELSGDHLLAFAAEHHHAVVALAAAARSAAAQTSGLLAEQLTTYADDQDDCIEQSYEFAAATGWTTSSWWYFAEDPLPQTIACARAWSGENRPLAHRLVVIYAIESALSELAPRQLDALRGGHRFDERATRYFTVHADRSASDAALAWAALTSLLPLPSPRHLVTPAELAYRSYWELLDGVQTLVEPTC